MTFVRTQRRTRTLQVESLESKTLLSGIPTMGLRQAPALVAHAAVTQVALNATTKGLFYTTKANPDTGTTYHIFTTGKTSGGAVVGVSGDLTTPGFIAQGRTSGTLTIFTTRGSLTLNVTGPLQAGFTPLPSTLGFTITGGTGAFANVQSGTGKIAVKFHVLKTTSGASVASLSQTGTISITFKAGSAVV